MTPGLADADLDDRLTLSLAREQRLRKIRRVMTGGWKGAVALLGLLGTVVGLYAFLEERLRDKPVAHLAGDLRLGVAPFTTSGIGAPQAESLARQIRTDLDRELDRHARMTGVTFGVAPPPRVDPVDAPADALAAAETLNADVLVYGSMEVKPFETVVAPRFAVSSRILSDAEELIGDERLGAPIRVSASVVDSVAARVSVRRQLAARTRALASFAVGVSFFASRDYRQADDWFRRADAASSASGGDVREVVLLFRGHTAGRTGDLDAAERFYAQALAAEPGYPRARFGLAEVRFQRAHGTCARDHVDARGLRAAYRDFVRVESPHGEPYAAVLDSRADLGRARVLLCLSQAGIEPRWEDAEALLRAVVRGYEAGEQALRDEASESLGYLGLIALPRDGASDAGDRLRTAAGLYRRALALSSDPGRQAVFWSMLGFINGRVGDSTAADAAYTHAIELAPDAPDRRRYERARRALGNG